MFNINKLLILLVIFVFLLIPSIYSVGYAPPCGTETGIFIPGGSDIFPGAPEEGLCIACDGRTSIDAPSSPISDGVCLDSVSSYNCILNNVYDPDCTYSNEKMSGYDAVRGISVDYDFCNEGIDNDKDTFIDFNDKDCNTLNLQNPIVTPTTVPEGETIAVTCEFKPTIKGPTSVTFKDNGRPGIDIIIGSKVCNTALAPIVWNGNKAADACIADSDEVICHAIQEGTVTFSTTTKITLQLKSCAAKGGVLSCQTGYYCTSSVAASDGTCCLACTMDLRDSDGDGLTNYEEVLPGVDGYVTNPNLADTDGDGVSDGPLAPPGSGLTPGPDPAPNYACTISNGGIEICDNKDNNCNGKIDEQLTQQCGATDVGECSYGTETCSAGAWIGCTAITPKTEICTDLKDNNCDDKSDYDTKQDLDMGIRHGDSACPVSVTAITLSKTTIKTGDAIDITCTVSPIVTNGFNSIFAYIDNNKDGIYNTGDQDLGWNDATDSWSPDFSKVYFKSKTITPTGNIQINCGVYSSSSEPYDRSYQSGADVKASLLEVLPSQCSQRTQTNCQNLPDCKWIAECRSTSPKYSGGVGRCVETVAVISYQCSVAKCAQQCDGSNLINVCTSTSQCSGKVYQLRTPSCDTASICTCQYSSWVSQACTTSLCSADCNAGTTQDSNVDYCNTQNGNIYNKINGCSGTCIWDDAFSPDTIKETCTNTCLDSDNGKIYTTQGIVTDTNLCSSYPQITCPSAITKIDSCSGETLTEYSCSNNDFASETKDCNTLNTVNVNIITNECSWNDYGCSTGACSIASSSNLDCDNYDDTNGNDGIIADSKTTASTCKLGCSGTNCCTSSSYTSDGKCGTKIIEGITYYAYNDGYNKWGAKAVVDAIPEICNDGKDNNCNSLIDSEDPKCVTVTSISAPLKIVQNVNFEIRCGSTIDSNCIGVKINSIPKNCFSYWDSTTAVFSCSTSETGTINLECYISNKPDGSCTIASSTAIPQPSSKTTTAQVISSICGSRTEADCPFDNKCEFCPTCGSATNPFSTNSKFSSGLSSPGTCVQKNTCLEKYQCRKDQCNAVCDKDTWSSCLGYQSCDETISCLCVTKSCTSTEIGQKSSHPGDPGKEYCCAGTAPSPFWKLIDGTLTETSCNDNKDNDCDGLTDCLDPDCNGQKNSGDKLCCAATGQTLCNTLNTNCQEFSSCVNDNTKRGIQRTYSCSVQKICDENIPTPCDVSCSNQCCVPGKECTASGTLSDIDLDEKKEICNSGDWIGADCTLSGCTSTDNNDYNCLTPNDCSYINEGDCGEKTCINYRCGTKRATNAITKCKNLAISLNYECADVSLDPVEACKETSPGIFTCQFLGESKLCSNKYPLGYDAGCTGSPDYKCSKNVCQNLPNPCCLCYSQCVIAANDPSKAPSSLEDCDVAKNGYWSDPQACEVK